MHKEHIVVLKKIPVDPKHVGALRIGIGKDITEHVMPVMSQESEVHRVHMVGSPLVYRVCSFFLLGAFVINPIGVAYAEEVTPLPDVPTVVIEQGADEVPLEKGVTIVVPPSEESAGETTLPDNTSDNTATSSFATTTDTTLPPNEGDATSTATTTEGALPLDDATSTATSTDPLGDTGSSTPTETEEQSATTTPEETPAVNLNREQTPEERAAERAAAEVVMREQIKKEVEAEMRSRCVSYGDDGYYCLDSASSKKITTQAPIEQVVVSRENGGDKEIVLVRTLPEGETREFITENNTDDDFPSADGEMHMIVWQSLVNGRWQVAYKEATGTVEYLTANEGGSGHPATDGKRIVWQGWVTDHWEIFLAEPEAPGASFGNTPDEASIGIHPGWKVTQLSRNASHGMFPKIAGNYVTWQEHRGEVWVVVVYDLSTGQQRIVEGQAGGTGETPTVALVFKERTKEGQVFIRASDLATGERIPLRDDEIPEPVKLPIPEQSGALPLQNGTSSISTMRLEGDGDGGAPGV